MKKTIQWIKKFMKGPGWENVKTRSINDHRWAINAGQGQYCFIVYR